MIHDLTAVRAELPALTTEVYLNSGGAGPLPRAAAAAMIASVQDDLVRGRMSLAVWNASEELLERTRVAAARAVCADPEDIGLTMNTSMGLGIAVWGLDWRPGDRIICTECEHPGLALHIATAARRLGLQVDWIPSAAAHDDLAGAVAAACTPRTRMVALSHVTWTTGAVLDVAGAAAAARAAGAMCVVDGAQSVGAIRCDPAALGVDVYAFPGQKWLLGPEGIGGVWVSPEARERLDLTYTGIEAGTDHTVHGDLTPYPGARRYETSAAPMVCAAGWLAALDWLDGLGWEWIHGRIAGLHATARAALEAIPGVRLLTPPGPQAGILGFTIDGTDPERAAAAIAERGVIIRWLADPSALRVCTGFYNDDEDIRAFAAAVAALAP